LRKEKVTTPGKSAKDIVNQTPTADELEKYHKERQVDGDPMANYVDTMA